MLLPCFLATPFPVEALHWPLLDWTWIWYNSLCWRSTSQWVLLWWVSNYRSNYRESKCKSLFYRNYPCMRSVQKKSSDWVCILCVYVWTQKWAVWEIHTFMDCFNCWWYRQHTVKKDVWFSQLSRKNAGKTTHLRHNSHVPCLKTENHTSFCVMGNDHESIKQQLKNSVFCRLRRSPTYN